MRQFDEFVKLVTKYFRYLETSYGFKQKPIDPTRSSVYYESPSKEISIFWDYSFQHELDLGIYPPENDPASIETPYKSVHIEDLMELKDRKNYRSYYPPFPGSIEELESEIENLAKLLKEYGRDVLTAEVTFDSLYKQVDFQRNSHKEDLKHIIKRQEAYCKKKYPGRF